MAEKGFLESLGLDPEMLGYLFSGSAAPLVAIRGLSEGLQGQKAKDEALQRLLERGGGPPAITGQTSLRAGNPLPELTTRAQIGKFLLARILPKLAFGKVGGIPTFLPGGK